MSSAKAQRLNAHVKVRAHHLRSVHLEHHEGQLVDTYIPTGRALEVLHRVSRAMMSGDAGRAWSLTGDSTGTQGHWNRQRTTWPHRLRG
jgi:hypothetical protein